jgi:hypothetical protein
MRPQGDDQTTQNISLVLELGFRVHKTGGIFERVTVGMTKDNSVCLFGVFFSLGLFGSGSCIDETSTYIRVGVPGLPDVWDGVEHWEYPHLHCTSYLYDYDTQERII